jgi:hypothetical protein
LKRHEFGPKKWVDLYFVNEFIKMRDIGLSLQRLYESLKHSTIVEVKYEEEKDMYYIRKKERINQLEFLGYSAKGIKELSIEQLNKFFEIKEKFQDLIIQSH